MAVISNLNIHTTSLNHNFSIAFCTHFRSTKFPWLKSYAILKMIYLYSNFYCIFKIASYNIAVMSSSKIRALARILVVPSQGVSLSCQTAPKSFTYAPLVGGTLRQSSRENWLDKGGILQGMSCWRLEKLNYTDWPVMILKNIHGFEKKIINKN